MYHVVEKRSPPGACHQRSESQSLVPFFWRLAHVNKRTKSDQYSPVNADAPRLFRPLQFAEKDRFQSHTPYLSCRLGSSAKVPPSPRGDEAPWPSRWDAVCSSRISRPGRDVLVSVQAGPWAFTRVASCSSCRSFPPLNQTSWRRRSGRPRFLRPTRASARIAEATHSDQSTRPGPARPVPMPAPACLRCGRTSSLLRSRRRRG